MSKLRTAAMALARADLAVEDAHRAKLKAANNLRAATRYVEFCEAADLAVAKASGERAVALAKFRRAVDR